MVNVDGTIKNVLVRENDMLESGELLAILE